MKQSLFLAIRNDETSFINPSRFKSSFRPVRAITFSKVFLFDKVERTLFVSESDFINSPKHVVPLHDAA